MKRIISFITLGMFIVSSVYADTFTWNIPAATPTNILSAPIKITAMIVTTTNTTTLTLMDAPSNLFTNIIPAFTNISVYATNQIIQWTNYYGVSNGYVLTNALTRTTNSNATFTNTYATIFSQQYPSNQTTVLQNLGITFVNGILVTNNPYALTLTVTYTGN